MTKRAKLKTFFIVMLGISASIYAIPADFELKATFKRNPKIWGTYKLANEKVTIKRGKKKWRKTPPNRIGDIIISKGNLVFLRETQNNDQTTIVVDKIPYKKQGDQNYHSKLSSTEERQIVAKLFEKDIRELIPHRDLIEGDIDYHSVKCTKSRGQLTCKLKGSLRP